MYMFLKFAFILFIININFINSQKQVNLMKKLFIALIAFLTLTSCNLVSLPNCNSVIDGHINGHMSKTLDKCPLNYDSTIELTSTGGFIEPAFNIADKVALNDTTILIVDYCNSSCLIVALSAINRVMCSNSYMIFHQTSTIEGTEVMMDFYSQNDRIDFDVLTNIIANTPFELGYAVMPIDALNYGFIDTIINC